MAWTEPDDVLARWLGDKTPPPVTQITAWITDAETIIRSEFPTIQDRIDDEDEPLSLDTVRMVVCSMVLRVIRNPEQARSETLGPYSFTRGGDSPGALTLTAEERALLDAESSTIRGLWALSTTRDDLETRVVNPCWTETSAVAAIEADDG